MMMLFFGAYIFDAVPILHHLLHPKHKRDLTQELFGRFIDENGTTEGDGLPNNVYPAPVLTSYADS